MPLTLKIIAPTNLPAGQTPEYTFDELGGSIGRKPNNDFILVDPERFISSQHAHISFQGGNFLITDTSTNGVFVNHSKRPIGNGNTQEIANGDKVSIGEFQLQFTVSNVAQNNTPWNSANASLDNSSIDSLISPIATPPMTPSVIDNFEFSEPLIPDNGGADEFNSMDPLALLGGMGTEQQDSLIPSSPMTSQPTSDLISSIEVVENPHQNIPEPLPINEPFSPPSAIPDDWDIMGDSNSSSANVTVEPQIATDAGADSLFPETQMESTTPLIPDSESLFDGDDIFASLENSAVKSPAPVNQTTPKAVAPPPVAAQPQTPPVIPKQAPAPPIQQTASANTTNNELLNAFIVGAGMDPGRVQMGDPKELMTKLGQLTRISTEGLMMALRARATIKSSFRVNKTIIAPIENNPLKFSVTSEDALNIVFSGDKAGYMSATEAFSEGFKDLQTHQMAMMAGMQGTIKAITEQFHPVSLEQKFDSKQTNSGFSLPGNKKAKNWEMYEQFYKKITLNLQDDFQNVYGEEFARAYESQILKLL